MRDLKLGKKPAKFGNILWSIQHYLDLEKLPTPPPAFGHYVDSYRMGLNDKLSSCVVVGAQNETLDWYSDAGRQLPEFTDQNVISDYMAVSDYDGRDPETDTGVDMGRMARYRKNTGIVDRHGNRHKVDAYAKVPLRRLDWIKTLAYLYGGVGFGFLFPESAKQQFDRGQPWSVVRGDDIQGGHYVPLLGFDGRYFVTVSWGRKQLMTEDFAMKYMDEVICWLDFDRTRDHVSPEGFHEDTLLADIAILA